MTMSKIVYTYGAFDLLHTGHIKLLQKARSLGSFLIVGIVADGPIKKLKGDDRPIMSCEDRMELVAALRCVGRVVFQPSYDPTSVLEELNVKIDILVKGDDWDYIPGTETIERLGGQLVKLPYTEGPSTSGYVKKIRGEK